jgi:hypothetical protein
MDWYRYHADPGQARVAQRRAREPGPRHQQPRRPAEPLRRGDPADDLPRPRGDAAGDRRAPRGPARRGPPQGRPRGREPAHPGQRQVPRRPRDHDTERAARLRAEGDERLKDLQRIDATPGRGRGGPSARARSRYMVPSADVGAGVRGPARRPSPVNPPRGGTSSSAASSRPRDGGKKIGKRDLGSPTWELLGPDDVRPCGSSPPSSTGRSEGVVAAKAPQGSARRGRRRGRGGRQRHRRHGPAERGGAACSGVPRE